jgi:hypothetical protein
MFVTLTSMSRQVLEVRTEAETTLAGSIHRFGVRVVGQTSASIVPAGVRTAFARREFAAEQIRVQIGSRVD